MSLKLGGALKELRIHLCQTSRQSIGVRQFIQKHYIEIKQANPGFPILIRECAGAQPRVWARYERGVERSSSLTDLKEDDIMKVIKQLAK